VFGNKSSGFSLLELLITLMIIAILVGVALPSYNHIMITAHRVDGKIGLLQLAAQLEKGSGPISEYSPEGFYKLVVVEKKSDYFLLAAYPLKSQLQDKTCGVLAFNSLGQKGILDGRGNENQDGIRYGNHCW
jgi:type IV pilus assembly protein PilE